MIYHRYGFLNFIAATCFIVLFSPCASVAGSCSVSTTPINFGSYDIFSSAANTSTGTISLSCSSKTDVTIDISDSSISGSYYPRKMRHNNLSDTLDYNLYTSANRTRVWGDGNHGTSDVHLSNVKNNTPAIIIYGSIEPLQNVSTGVYNDQLVVTISY
jgi:spore coat protein U-like protein